MSKTIFRIEKNADNPFVMIDRRPIENPNLSWKAKGVLAYLLSRPDNWVIRLGDLLKRSPDGSYAVRQAVKELREAGHLEMETIRDNNRIKQWVYRVYEIPLLRDNQQVGNQQVGNRAVNDTDSNEKNQDDDKDFGAIVKLYEANIGPITEISSAKLVELYEEYKSEPDGLNWLPWAFEVAVSANVRRLDYITKCLANRKEHGKDWKPVRSNGSKTPAPAEPKAFEAVRRFAEKHGVELNG